ncbi:MAG: TIGR03747 family integrating conjugative element membrane protein [Hydrogenophaga sp.]|jgi:integrating conjugative element membrane protein (TIGR03747 family)|uniref:TIGR03747 family integrating conjugative element membrane protein n=1 Tax=Hydrogenophaga sp. TaxID=1904254 RepID=UPI0025C3BDAB|nr:TIGR03747 family integrating conjugative element membrane protein [Hydrogenophaga sp.]MBU4281572.1 TIGR03747 family integrating conjugative element membrane protein [Gammaproteobacteria bacterium]MBU4505190.1 TIGR03747 family integrating conjugative element membrane protein [Gammaproteobacteria bacterium]MCG2654262.1 TIGR03747 family integrating conjugative element membrane protein [Hydrogenophaga sp.]MDO9480146.1 TIGR03747 family integrating conjugative element membrane protein [Hydrogenoph
MSAAPSKGPARARTRGPVELGLEVAFGLLFVTLFAWFIGVLIEIVGSYTLWREDGELHSQEIVAQDLEYIAIAPRSLLVRDTVEWSHRVVGWVELPYERVGLKRWYERLHGENAAALSQPSAQQSILSQRVGKANASLQHNLSKWVLMSMYVAQDVLLRLSVAAFALPAFVLACMVGIVDGLVRRDLRRWGGGRESSFVYHHAKRYTQWALTGGFGLYLAWPFGGFNPAYMVFVFTMLVAFTMSTAVAAFKKYV